MWKDVKLIPEYEEFNFSDMWDSTKKCWCLSPEKLNGEANLF